MYFRSSTRRRFPLQFDLIVIYGGTDEIFQSAPINLIALEKIDRSPLVACEARVEELVRIREARPIGKGKLHLIPVGVGDRDHSVVRPHRASHPLPFLDDLPVGLKDGLADAGKHFAAPVREFCDQLVNTFRWIHWIFMPPILVPFSGPQPTPSPPGRRARLASPRRGWPSCRDELSLLSELAVSRTNSHPQFRVRGTPAPLPRLFGWALANAWAITTSIRT